MSIFPEGGLESFALIFFATVALIGVAWVLMQPLLSGESQARKRRDAIVKAERVGAVTIGRSAMQQRSRRDQVEQSLKDMEARQKANARVPLAKKITQAGLTVSKERFLMMAGAGAVFAVLLLMLLGLPWLFAIAFGIILGIGAPLWLLKKLKMRRERKFMLALPDAIDVIVRGIKAGLPLNDSIRAVAADAPQPLREEFAKIVESQAVGITMGEACSRLYERMPVPEANFFGIVVTIQQQSGGNLAEALGNLSRVLRERKKMAEKIKAVSQEAKASAAIIGAMPIAVMLMVWFTSPDYMTVMWTHPHGQMMLAGCVLWMTIGVVIMRKMINFDF